ncbi:MAG: efflux RND transporter permease subunit [Planctomycetota bacterium]
MVEGLDPESRDYMAWVAFACSDPEFDATTLHEFMERRLLPRLERIEGVSEVGMMGTREREVHVVVDPAELARLGITYAELRSAIDRNNDNYSGGKLEDGKNDIRVRAVGRFENIDEVAALVVRRDARGTVQLGDIAEVREGYKELTTWARSRGHFMPFFNFTLEHGANMLQTMDRLKAEFDKLNAPGGLLEQEARRRGINGNLQLVVNFDATEYVNEAVGLVRSNIVVGGGIAILVLLLFLRSLRVVGIIALAIPISVIASIAILVAMGRTVNIISLAGMAFAVGMVVDNAIVVIENIFRHLELGKPIKEASLEGTKEVAGAVVASTLTTLVVFLPILLIQDSAGQLFRDIALAIMASVGLSLIVSVTVIPSAANVLLGGKRPRNVATSEDPEAHQPFWVRAPGDLVHWLMSSKLLSAVSALVLIVGTGFGIWKLMPPMDYLPAGNRNIVFGMLMPPPAYSINKLTEIGQQVEGMIRPQWEVAGPRYDVERVLEGRPIGDTAEGREPHLPDRRQELHVPPMGPGDPGRTVMPPPIEHYFLVGWNGMMFHGAIAHDASRVADLIPLLNVAGNIVPDVFGFAFQMPLFNNGGTTGSAVKVDMSGNLLSDVEQGAGALMGALMESFGQRAVRPDPMNFSTPTPELRLVPNDERLGEAGMSRMDVGLAMQANADGLILPRQYASEGDLQDVKILSPGGISDNPIAALQQVPLVSGTGQVVALNQVTDLVRVSSPDVIKHVNRQRAVTLEVTPPPGLPLQEAIDTVQAKVDGLRQAGVIPAGVEVNMAGSAGKLKDIQRALFGDGTWLGTLTSSMVLASIVIYLLMVVLFQSWVYPLVILVSVPFATLGGFAALRLVHVASVRNPYLPVQNMDVLTVLGFVILAGVVVNNAILIVHQSLNFLNHGEKNLREAITHAVSTRVRPIAMSTLTSVGGMLPLVLMPGSGSELYRGLGAVVVGGLLVSTFFTLILVPILLYGVFWFDQKLAGRRATEVAQ